MSSASTWHSAQAGTVAPPAPPPKPPISDPEPFAGDLNQCRGFLFQCRTVLAQRPRALPTERSGVDYVIGRLLGRALSWAQALHANGTLETLTAEGFLRRIEQVFDRPDYASGAADRLFTIRQGDRSVAEYTVEFHLLAEETGWNEPALVGAFQRGLSRPVRDALMNGARPANLQALVDRAVEIDNYQRERRREQTFPSCFPRWRRTHPPERRASPQRNGWETPGDQPMQVAGAEVPMPGRRRGQVPGICGHCGAGGHDAVKCLYHPKAWARQRESRRWRV